MAGTAFLELGQFQLQGMAKHGLSEFQFDLIAQVRAAKHLGAAAAAPGRRRKCPRTHRQDIVEGIRATLPRAALCGSLESGNPC